MILYELYNKLLSGEISESAKKKKDIHFLFLSLLLLDLKIIHLLLVWMKRGVRAKYRCIRKLLTLLTRFELRCGVLDRSEYLILKSC